MTVVRSIPHSCRTTSYRWALISKEKAADKGAASRHHRRFVSATLLFALATLAFGLAKSSQRAGSLTSLEAVAVVAALLSVGVGTFAASQEHWLLERHKAERLRLLKFGFLTDPRTWSHHAPLQRTAEEHVREELVKIDCLTMEGIKAWRETPEIPDIEEGSTYVQGELQQLAEYYRAKRIDVQRKYFSREASRHGGWERLTWGFAPAFFYGSVLCALGHVLYELASGNPAAATQEQGAISQDGIGASLIFFAVGLPVVGAGLRTFRAAHEFARNRSRFLAKQTVLDELSKRIGANTISSNRDVRTLFHDMWLSEKVIESDHREWLRLMIDAEWYG